MGDEIGQLSEAPLIEEKHESSMRLPSPPAASSASQVLLAARAPGVSRWSSNSELIESPQPGSGEAPTTTAQHGLSLWNRRRLHGADGLGRASDDLLELPAVSNGIQDLLRRLRREAASDLAQQAEQSRESLFWRWKPARGSAASSGRPSSSCMRIGLGTTHRRGASAADAPFGQAGNCGRDGSAATTVLSNA